MPTGLVMPISELARAKVNLALHVKGRRDDGYHLLDSIVAFADCADWITLTPADRTSLSIDGPFSDRLAATDDNSALRALRLFPDAAPVAIHIEKNLPVAAGIGGGSADAAAVLRAYARRFRCDLPDGDAVLQLGADVPVCLDQQPVRMRGIGEELTKITLPDMPAVLVNPSVAVSTPAVFAGLARRDNAGIGAVPTGLSDVSAAIGWLSGLRNDLEPAARTIAPEINQVLAELLASGAALSRMSGSGATCFGLFVDMQAARTAAARISAERPGWWVCPTRFRPPAT